MGRGAEGIIAIDTALEHELSVPVVAVAGHKRIPGVTNVLLDHKHAAELALRHLQQLGHRHIAFMRGQPFSSDSNDRWKSIVAVAREIGIEIRPELTIQLEKDLTSPELGYPVHVMLGEPGSEAGVVYILGTLTAVSDSIIGCSRRRAPRRSVDRYAAANTSFTFAMPCTSASTSATSLYT